MRLQQNLLEGQKPVHSGALVGQARGLIIGQKIDLTGNPREFSGQFPGIPVGIVNAFQQDVLEHNPFSFRHGKIPAGIQQLVDGIAIVDGHQPAPRFIVYGMQGNGQIHRRFLPQFAHFRYYPAGRDGNSPGGEVEAFLFGYDRQRVEDILKIVERFAHPHKDHIGYPIRPDKLLAGLSEEVVSYAADLVDDLRRGEISLEAHGSGKAEGTSHGAAHLRRDAQGVSVRFRNEDRFDNVAVTEPEAELDAAVCRFLDKRIGETGNKGMLRQDTPEFLCQIGHLGKIRNPRAIEPTHYLFAAKGRLAEAFDVGNESRLGEILQIDFIYGTAHKALLNSGTRGTAPAMACSIVRKR